MSDRRSRREFMGLTVVGIGGVLARPWLESGGMRAFPPRVAAGYMTHLLPIPNITEDFRVKSNSNPISNQLRLMVELLDDWKGWGSRFQNRYPP